MCIARNGAMKDSAERTLIFYSMVNEAVQWLLAREAKSGREMLKSKSGGRW